MKTMAACGILDAGCWLLKLRSCLFGYGNPFNPLKINGAGGSSGACRVFAFFVIYKQGAPAGAELEIMNGGIWDPGCRMRPNYVTHCVETSRVRKTSLGVDAGYRMRAPGLLRSHLFIETVNSPLPQSSGGAPCL